MDHNKKFGLIITKRNTKVNIKSVSVFDSDSDDETPRIKRPKIPQKKLDTEKKIKTESVDDPSIYEYDSIYDDMKAKQAESIAPREKKNCRYIETLLKAADKRKKEYERRVEKKIQKERENEGDKYKDKEAFVTSSYKKKIQEMEEEEERERRENMINDMMDVTKQKDLNGFYRHFLKQTVGEEKIPIFGETQVKEEAMSGKEEEISTEFNKDEKEMDRSSDYINEDKDSDGIEIDSDSSNEDDKHCRKKYLKTDSVDASSENDKLSDSSLDKSKDLFTQKLKKYRTKKSLITLEKSSTSDSEMDNNDKENTLSAKVKDSFANKPKKQKKRIENVSDEIKLGKTFNSGDKSVEERKKTEKCDRKEFNKQNIFAKRTVGDVFSEAQARYFQRMAGRNAV